MTTELLPVEISELATKVSETKKEEVSLVLTQIFTGTDNWERQVDAIEIKGVDDTLSISLAEAARKNAKSARLNAEKIFDAKRSEVQIKKAEYDTEDKLWLKAKQVAQIKFKAIEEKAEWKANYAERVRAEQREATIQKRIGLVSAFAEINRIEFENMTDDVFDSFLVGLKATHDARVEAERLAEVERIAKEKAEQERIEAQRIENEKLKAEAAILAKQKAEADAILAKERADREAEAKKQADIIAKQAAEIKAKKDAELKAEAQRKAEAEKNAKAPVKQQLLSWVNGFSIPELELSSNTKVSIEQKFQLFKQWAITEIEKI